MPVYETLKRQLVRISDDTARLLDNAEKITELIDEGLSQWKTTCQTISEQVSEEIMRVAVVGAIKSGKSTFVNTLFGGDYLKRGAGVVTSIVTRVRTGSRLRAILYLKNWDEVNREIDQASLLLPAHNRSTADHPFDIRREKDRQILERALADLAADQLITNDTRSAGSVLLDSYLKGYDRVRQLVEADHATAIFEKERFALHRDFVGDDAMAVYLKDALLEIDAPGLGGGVEIADCQGSDAPNPLHLAMIQDYLMMAHLTVYVISSRTGLRQADIRFLSMIRKMGILATVAFVVNCDLSEHESLEDLSEGIRKIEADLSLICPEPQLFTFSALFSLMSQMESDLSRRDRDRFAHWCRETAMVSFATAERTRFQRFLEQKINQERSSLLLKNHLERLEIVAGGIGNWIDFNRDLLTRDAGGARELADRVHHQRGRLERLKLTVKNTLDGAVSQVKRDLKTATDRFFDVHTDGVVDGVVRLVRGYQVEMQRYDESLMTIGFAKTLYMVFQEFKQAVDAHMAESVNPQVIRFVKAQEKILMGYLDEIAGPYAAMIDEALEQYANAMDDVNMRPRRVSSRINIGPDLETIRKMAGLSLPPAAATMRYSAQIKTEAVMRFGFYKIVNLVKKAMKKSADKVHQEQFLALASGVKRMKRETERSILFHLKDYKENLKFQYMLKLADAAAAALYRQLLERFQLHGADLSRLVELMVAHGLNKENVSASLDQMRESSKRLQEKIGQLKADLPQLND
ncbi:dynamin family protein [Desulfosarcina sp.]|uniref:dynamin family protein n=1 Tax=Desulfosarcina sp. TaxID=2027861 RepID=UPI0029A0F044|nr:dynamin family protein [Desulfosarcina sp.]MDX2452536.1 dynamin family protein [Desulfosarcina sp.]